MKKDINRKSKKIDRLLELPQEVYSNEPRVIINSFKEVLIENYKGILEYEEFIVKISTFIGVINVNGYNLNLETMTNDDIKITGKIEGINLERTID